MSTPDREVDVRRTFGFDSPFAVRGYSRTSEHVPQIDTAYRFDPDTTLAILAGFSFGRNVLLQGYHGTGKTSHIEQVAARLNWPCVRINLDGHVSRIDLIGKDAIVIRDGKQVTEFVEGMLPWALTRNVALVLDEYDAGRPDVMFVFQRVLESDGALTLIDQSRVLRRHPAFRMFATANTVGLGDATGLYQGTQLLNQGQLDRWDIVATLNYLQAPTEIAATESAPAQTEGEAPRGRGPYGICATPRGEVWYCSLAASFVAQIDLKTGESRIAEPPTKGQGARRVWSDSHGRIWVSEWNSGQVSLHDPRARGASQWRAWKLPGDSPRTYAVYVDDKDMVWLSDFGANAVLRFDPHSERFDSWTHPREAASVRQILGRPGEVWLPESGTEHIALMRTA